jgi:diguanylate cyclase (GGDEF)-like protein
MGDDRSFARLITVVALTSLAALAIILGIGLASGASTVSVVAEALAIALLIGCLGLVRLGRTDLVRMLLPIAGWLIANASLAFSSEATPLAFASLNAIIILLAGALLGHRAVAVFTGLAIALIPAGLVAASVGLVNITEGQTTGWPTAVPVLIMISLLSFYAFRAREMALDVADRSANELATLARAAAVVSQSLQLEETIGRIFDQLQLVIPYDSASVQVLADGFMEIVGTRGWEPADSVVGIRFPVPGDNPNTVVVEKGEPYILSDAPNQHPAFANPPHDHIRSWLGVPLHAGERTIGMLSIDSSEPGRYGEHDARLAQAFADHVAIALQNARHFQAERRRHQQSVMQQDILQVISSSLDLDEVLARVCQLTAEAVGADRCSVYLRQADGEPLKLRTSRTADGEVEPELMARMQDVFERTNGEAVWQEALDAHRPLLLSGPDPAGREYWQTHQTELGVQDLLVVPLITHDQSIGAMALVSLDAERPFGEEQIGFAATIAASVSAAVANARLLTQTTQLARTDSLTQLLNRRGFADFSERELAFGRRFGRPMALLMIDLDHFKRLNDAHGHPTGDDVLAGVAGRLTGCLRAIDLIGRHGGEEFVVLLPETTLEAAGLVAERLRASIASPPFETRSGPLPMTVSIGASALDNGDGSINQMIDDADQALYAAKQAGRDQVWLWLEGQAGAYKPASSA